MKLVVGMATIDDYPALAEAGADEVFCGYIPASWGHEYGMATAMNRREVLFPNVQIGSESELAILADVQDYYQVPVALTLNAPAYPKETIPFLLDYIERCVDMGLDRFIIADENLLQALQGKELAVKIHLSGEYGELNHLVLMHLERYEGIERIIFPRQTEIKEMKSLVPYGMNKSFEAFFLNEKCHYTGAYCNSLHSDFFCHICQLPYQLEGANLVQETNLEATNASGCGYCALWKLRDAGVSHLKIVSRGNYTEETIKDVKRAREALEILKAVDTEEAYIETMKEKLFPEGCSGNCYY